MKREFMKMPLLAGLMALAVAVSCDKDNKKGYEGVNKIYLTATNPVVEEDGDTPLAVSVELTYAIDKDITLDFALLDDENGVLTLDGNPVTISAGSKAGSFNVLSNRKNLLVSDTYFKIGLPSVPEENMALDAELSVRVKPNPEVPELSEAQIALVEGYRTKYGVDMTAFMGIVSVHAEVISPAGGYTTPFAEEFTRTFDGKTIITIGETATADTPVLKMTDNPMGLTEYLFWVLRQETVENDEFWYGEYAGPSYTGVMNLLGWNKDNPGEFSMSLDSIRVESISSSAATLGFVYEKSDEWGETTSFIPFRYAFSPWELQKKLIAEGNADAIEYNETGGTANPEAYLMTSSVAEDAYDDALNFVAPEGSIDFTTGKMTFRFVFDHSLAGGYTRATVTYEKK